MNAGERIALALLPVPSTSLLSEVVFEHPGGTASLRFEFERDGVPYRQGLQFDSVRAFRFRTEGHCTAWHVEAYDTLIEVLGSEWVGELLAAEPSGAWGHWKIRHFMIYIDSRGCYEVGAESWSWLPEERLA